MITEQQFYDWAQSSTKHPVLLVEITHKDGTVYLSDQFYATSAGETPAHVSYDVCLKQTVLIEKTLDADSLGSLRVYNDGSLDHWLDLLFIDYEIEILIGDASWPRSDFKRQYLGTIDSFFQLSADSFEIKSTVSTGVVQDQIYNVNLMRIAGSQTNQTAKHVGTTSGNRLYRIAMTDQFDRANVNVKYNGSSAAITWVEQTATNSAFYINDYPAGTAQVQFDCVAYKQKFKEFFAYMCTEYAQAYNADNLAAYPIDPDINFYITQSMTFPEFLELSLETVGAIKWTNEAGEIELHRKDLPTSIYDDAVKSFITASEISSIKTITEEYPVAAMWTYNAAANHLEENGTDRMVAYNAIESGFPTRFLINHSYASAADASAEMIRLMDLLSITRRTYSVSINRITPELFIGAIVNIYSPKDRWNNGTEGLNALVVGITQSFKSNKSELIVWR